MPFALNVAHFLRFYGHDMYCNPRWPTRDHVIPFKLFWMLLNATRSVMATERISQSNAMIYAALVANGGDSASARKIARREEKEQFGEY